MRNQIEIEEHVIHISIYGVYVDLHKNEVPQLQELAFDTTMMKYR
jgi:hypothetical protein